MDPPRGQGSQCRVGKSIPCLLGSSSTLGEPGAHGNRSLVWAAGLAVLVSLGNWGVGWRAPGSLGLEQPMSQQLRRVSLF